MEASWSNWTDVSVDEVSSEGFSKDGSRGTKCSLRGLPVMYLVQVNVCGHHR